VIEIEDGDIATLNLGNAASYSSGGRYSSASAMNETSPVSTPP
jgi:hypothetical protein